MAQGCESAVLIVTNKFDPHVDLVATKLNELEIPFIRLNTEDFPQQGFFHFCSKTLSPQVVVLPENRVIEANSIKSVWYRRPEAHQVDSSVARENFRIFAANESAAAIDGLFQLIPGLWVNKPSAIRIARQKIYQLKRAKDLGFEIPRTLITNQPSEAMEFFKMCNGRVVVKALSRPTVQSQDRIFSVFTNLVTEEVLRYIEMVRYCPTFFQECIPKKFDLRITVIGHKTFAVEIHSQTSDKTKIDFRHDDIHNPVPHIVHSLPTELASKCLEFTRDLSLNFSAIDILLTPDNRYIFLEINPNGQWAWLEERTGLPMRDAMIDLLTLSERNKPLTY